MTQSFNTTDNCNIVYTVHKAKPGASRLALIHSLALDASIWDGVVAEMNGSAEILTYDCRGHGHSGHPHMTYTAELFAADLAQLFDHIGWDSATVAGASMGGCVTQAMAGLFPARVNAQGLIDTTAWYGPDAPKAFRDRAAAARAKGMAGMKDFQVTRWFSDKWAAAHPDIVQKYMDVYVANDFECYEATCALLGDADLRHYQPSFKMPVAVVVGEEDYAAPIAMAKQMHEAIPGSTMKILSPGRHLTPIECPKEIAAELTALMKRV